ncbi:MAG: OmpA family protein [Deltaproteobacteria bacterium]|nr:OmpA family protein [Deltaproteobacteria bacterium]
MYAPLRAAALALALGFAPGAAAAPPAVAPPPVHFVYGKAELSGAEDEASIRQAVALLSADKRLEVVLLGFADPSGAAGANLELSHQRALVVQEKIVQSGVPVERVHVRGVGEQRVGGNPEDLRRVDFVFTRKKLLGGQPDIDALLASMGIVTTGATPNGAAGATAGGPPAAVSTSEGGSTAKTTAASTPSATKAPAPGAEGAEERIQPTGLRDVDSLFAKVQGLLDTVKGARKGITAAEAELYTVMGIAEGGSLSAALSALKAEAKGNLTLKVEGGKPRLSPKPGASPKVGQGVSAVNGLVKALADATAKLASVPKQAQAIIAEAKAIPGKVPSMAKDAGMSAKEVPKLLKAVKHNLKLTASIPKECAAVGTQAANTFRSIGSAFAGGGAPG